MNAKANPTKPSMLQIFWSMIAAFCGIQNSANHERDDSYIDEVGFLPYIIVGVGLTAMFVVGLYLLVQYILS
jgi:hypothetical protein